jgi:hypothetical protein
MMFTIERQQPRSPERFEALDGFQLIKRRLGLAKSAFLRYLPSQGQHALDRDPIL